MDETVIQYLSISPLDEKAFGACVICLDQILAADGGCAVLKFGGWPGLRLHVGCAERLRDTIHELCTVVIPRLVGRYLN